MKLIKTLLFILLINITLSNSLNADESESAWNLSENVGESESNIEGGGTLFIPTSIDFSPVMGGTCTDSWCNIWVDESPLQNFIWKFTKYFAFLTILIAVLLIVVNGIYYSMSWLDEWMKTKSKERIVKTIQWIVLLLLSGIILKILFPWIFK